VRADNARCDREGWGVIASSPDCRVNRPPNNPPCCADVFHCARSAIRAHLQSDPRDRFGRRARRWGHVRRVRYAQPDYIAEAGPGRKVGGGRRRQDNPVSLTARRQWSVASRYRARRATYDARDIRTTIPNSSVFSMTVEGSRSRLKRR